MRQAEDASSCNPYCLANKAPCLSLNQFYFLRILFGAAQEERQTHSNHAVDNHER